MQYKDPYIEICIESASSIFRGIDQKDKAALDSHHIITNYRKGEVILHEGNRQKGFDCLVKGKAKIFRTGAGNREQIIRMLKPQNFINYRSLFCDILNPFFVTAVEDSIVLTYDRQVFLRILKNNADLSVRFIKLLSQDLLFTDNRLVSLTQKHVRGRISESIILLRDFYGVEADGRTLGVLLSRDDLAHFSNMTTSNAIRTLSELVSENILNVHGRKIVILDHKKLEDISESGQ
jgi:CRP-like cAMP-binding protein